MDVNYDKIPSQNLYIKINYRYNDQQHVNVEIIKKRTKRTQARRGEEEAGRRQAQREELADELDCAQQSEGRESAKRKTHGENLATCDDVDKF